MLVAVSMGVWLALQVAGAMHMPVLMLHRLVHGAEERGEREVRSRSRRPELAQASAVDMETSRQA
jgi:hypothetical protein